MTIQEQINVDLKGAMLAKNEYKKSILRVLIGEFNRVGKVVDDAKAQSIIKKMVENATENGKLAASTGTDHASVHEIAILGEYLPKQLTTDQLTMHISQLIEDKGYTSVKDMGKIMGDLKNQFGGQYDGRLASDLIKARFTGIFNTASE